MRTRDVINLNSKRLNYSKSDLFCVEYGSQHQNLLLYQEFLRIRQRYNTVTNLQIVRKN
jgi:hypothetical protein